MNSPFQTSRGTAPNRRSAHGHLLLWRLLIGLCLFSLLAAAVAAIELQDVQFAAQPGNRVEIQLTLSAPVTPPETFVTEVPSRIALDFPGVTSKLDRKAVPIGVGAVHSLVAVEASDRTRVVLNLNEPVPYEVDTQGNRVTIRVDTQGEATAPPLPAAASRSDRQPTDLSRVAARPAPATTARAPRPTASGAAIRDIDFRRGDQGEGRVLIKLPSASTRVTVREQGSQVIVDLHDTSLPQRLFRRLDVVDFATPVVAVEARPKGRNVQVEVQTGSDFDFMAYQTNELFTLDFRPLTAAEKEQMAREKVVYEGDRLSLNFQDIEVRAILQVLADFTDLNLVASDSVQGNITLRLKNVPWDQALDIILKTKNLTKRQEGNVILVGPYDEIVGQEERQLSSEQKLEELAPLRSEFIAIKFAKAADIAGFLRGGSTLKRETKSDADVLGRTRGNSKSTVSESGKDSILTPGRGNVTFDERTNTILVVDTAAKLDEIRRIVERLDIPVRQVMIESRVVIANNDFARDLGVRFGLSTSMGAYRNNELMIAGGMPGNLSTLGFNKGPFGLNTEEVSGGVPGQGFNEAYKGLTYSRFNSGIENPSGSGNDSLIVNLPATDPSGAVNFLLGKVGSYLLQLELSAMQREGKGEVISSPRVITSDQKEATISVGQKIPYPTVSENGTNVQFEEAVLQLKVTPAITPDDRIIMDLVVNKDEPDFSRVVEGTPTINKREIDTRVLVDNGETVVLGGVFERTKTYSKEQVPWLGDVPVLGRLFKQEARIDNNSELLIFVTPKILKGDVALR